MKYDLETVYILLGSNKGDRFEMLSQSCELIEKMCGKITRHSSIYVTPPWEFKGDEHFLNQAIMLETNHAPQVLLDKLQIIELILGRVHYHDYYESRLIDLDILFYGQKIIKEANLCIPHPLLHKRLFTLIPLSEISQDFIHPVLKMTIHDLIESCNDKATIKKY